MKRVLIPSLALRLGATVIAVFLLGTFAVSIYSIATQGGIEKLQKADAILVLGAGHIDGEPSPVFQARLDRAHELFVQHRASFIVITGGFGRGAFISDSSVGKKYLAKQGVQESDIFIEEQSRTTKQNFVFAHEIMQEHDIDSALLVSHDFHMMRAKKMARDLGITIFPAPIKTKNASYYMRYVLREAMMMFPYL